MIRTKRSFAAGIALPALLLAAAPASAWDSTGDGARAAAVSAFQKGNDPYLDQAAADIFSRPTSVSAAAAGEARAGQTDVSAFRKGNDPYLDRSAEEVLGGLQPMEPGYSTAPDTGREGARQATVSAFRKGNDPYLDRAAEEVFGRPAIEEAPAAAGATGSGTPDQGTGSSR